MLMQFALMVGAVIVGGGLLLLILRNGDASRFAAPAWIRLQDAIVEVLNKRKAKKAKQVEDAARKTS